MTDGIQQVVQKVAEEAAQSQELKDTAPASEADVSKFADAMADGQAGGVDNAQNLEAKPVDATESTEQTRNLGDAILEGMEKVRAENDAQHQKVEAMLDKAADTEMTVQDMMRLQTEMAQMQLQQELTAKVADKTSQGVQTLFKNQ